MQYHTQSCPHTENGWIQIITLHSKWMSYPYSSTVFYHFPDGVNLRAWDRPSVDAMADKYTNAISTLMNYQGTKYLNTDFRLF